MNTAPADQDSPYESITELKEAHARLLEQLDNLLGADEGATSEEAALVELEPEIEKFLVRGATTGVFLDEVKSRTACQVLLDYWVSSLSSAGRKVDRVRLAAFDAERLPDLKDKQCPYVGLDAFRDETYFFGREEDTKRLLGQVQGNGLVVVVGASGSGKSSLVMGGLLPALSSEVAAQVWRIAEPFVPGNAVLDSFAASLLTIVDADTDKQEIAAGLRKDPNYLTRLLSESNGRPALITIDQFEEVFTLSDPRDRDALVASLAALLDTRPEDRLVLTVREEFRTRITGLRKLDAFLDSAWYSMRPMGYEQLHAAVEEPAALVNLQFQTGIVDRLVKRVLGQPAALPLLQFALRKLWDERDRNRVTWEVYERVGDPIEALKSSADGFYWALAPETRDEVKRILLALVRVDEFLETYRKPVDKQELLSAGRANTEEVLETLEDNDYIRITPGRNEVDAVVEIKHEALIRNWPMFVGWIAEKRIERQQRLALRQAAGRWADAGRPKRGLLTGFQLEAATQRRDLSPLEHEFVEASADALRREDRRKVRRRRIERIVGLVVLIVLASLVGALARKSRLAEERLALSNWGRAVSHRDSLNRPLEAAHFFGRAAGSPDEAVSDSSRLAAQDIMRVSKLAQALAHEDSVVGAVFTADEAGILSWSADKTVRLWDVATGEEVVALGHEARVRGAAFNQDGKRILSWGEDGTVRLWDVATGKAVIAPLRHDASVQGAAFSRDETQILSWSRGGTVRLWDATTGEEVIALRHEGLVVRGAVFNRDETRVLSWGDEGAVRLSDAATGEAVVALRHEGRVWGAAFNRDETRVLSWGDDGTVRLWDTATGEEVIRPLHHADWVRGAAFNWDEARILSWSRDGTVRLWDVATGEEVSDEPMRHSSHEGPVSEEQQVRGAVFTANETRILSWSWDGTVRLWDVATGEAVLVLRHEGPVRGAAFSADETRVLSWGNDGTVRLWDATTGEAIVVRHHQDWVWGAAFNRDETRILSWSRDGTVRLWDVADGTKFATQRDDAGIQGAAFSQDETRILSWSTGKTVRLWDAATGEEVIALRHADWVSGAVFTRDESRVLSWSWDSVVLWDAATGEEVVVLRREGLEVRGATFNQDETRILTWGDDKTVRLWEVANGKEVFDAPMRHDRSVEGATFSQDQSRILSWSTDNTVRLWDAATGEEIVVLRHEGLVPGAAFSQDQSRILSWSTDSTVRLWDVATGEEIVVLRHEDRVRGAAFNRDETRVLSWGDDGAVRLWDAKTGKEVIAPLRHADWVRGAVFNRDETRILSWSRDKTARLWDVATGEEVVVLRREGLLVRGAVFNRDETRVLSWGDDGAVRLWDAKTGKEVIAPLRHADWVRGAVFNRDETRILSWSEDGAARVWDVSYDPEVSQEQLMLEIQVSSGTLLTDANRLKVLSADEWLESKRKLRDSRKASTNPN